MTTNFSRVVAIDGPGGSGKSTVARLVAENMGMLYVDTGAMYRALGYYFDEKGVAFEDSKQLQDMLKEVIFTYGKSDECLVEINGENLTEKIRAHHVSDLASRISKVPSIRAFLLGVQRDLARTKTVVMEGRDIGTVVFPSAFCKIYLTADLGERAARRYKELKIKSKDSGQKVAGLEEIQEDLRLRDQRDMNRLQAPLKQAEDAILLDSTHLSIDQVVENICNMAQDFAAQKGVPLQ